MVSEVLEREKKSSVSAPARALLTHEYASMPNDTHNPLSWMVGTGKADVIDEGEDDRGDEHDAVGTSDAVDVGSSGAGDAVEAEVVTRCQRQSYTSLCQRVGLCQIVRTERVRREMLYLQHLRASLVVCDGAASQHHSALYFCPQCLQVPHLPSTIPSPRARYPTTKVVTKMLKTAILSHSRHPSQQKMTRTERRSAHSSMTRS
jgi:hypothetical protein